MMLREPCSAFRLTHRLEYGNERQIHYGRTFADYLWILWQAGWSLGALEGYFADTIYQMQ
jgi:hypothetical protein